MNASAHDSWFSIKLQANARNRPEFAASRDSTFSTTARPVWLYKFEQPQFSLLYDHFPFTSRYKTIAIQRPVVAFKNFLCLHDRHLEGGAVPKSDRRCFLASEQYISLSRQNLHARPFQIANQKSFLGRRTFKN